MIPTELSVTSAMAWSSSPRYPAGHDFQVEGFDEPLSVYERRVVLTGKLKVPEGLAGKSLELELAMRYQACNDKTCSRPLTIKLPATLRVASKGEVTHPVNATVFGE
ncbi:MAG: protein-disulfide reductase DsbD family protein [Planctomycetaceae bacterium]